MNRKMPVIQIVVFLVVCSFVVLFFYPIPKIDSAGIFFTKDNSILVIEPKADFSPTIHFSFPEEYEYRKTTFIEDSVLPKDQEGFVKETNVSMEVSVPNEHSTINAKAIIRSFRNGDVFLLLRLFSTQSVQQPIQFTIETIPVVADVAEVWSLEYHDTERPSESGVPNSDFTKYSLYKGMNILAPTLNYLELLQDTVVYGSVLMGAGSVYEKTPTELSNLTTMVSMDSQPIVEWNPAEKCTITSTVKLDAYQTSETWFFISKDQLLQMTNNETYENMRSADFTKRKKLTKDGILHIATEEYYVGASSDRLDYYYNYAGWEGRRFMNLYQKYPNQRLFYDMFVNIVYTTAKAASKYRIWPSAHRSQYLWNSYKLPMNYIDTRYCTDAGFFLLKAYNGYQIPEALYTGKRFGNYLVELAKKPQKIETENGFFFYDYYHSDYPEVATHASLNHILSEMNYLLELYLCTHDTDYLSTAEEILAAIEDTELSWIRTDMRNYRFYQDLWYSVEQKEDGTLFFEITHDYKTLTFEDLLKSQYLLQQIYNEESESIGRLIESKATWLSRNGYDVEEIQSKFDSETK